MEMLGRQRKKDRKRETDRVTHWDRKKAEINI